MEPVKRTAGEALGSAPAETPGKRAGSDCTTARAIERRYTIGEVAAIAHVGRDTVYNDIRRGALRCIRKRHSTRGIFVLESDLARWLDEEFEGVPACAV